MEKLRTIGVLLIVVAILLSIWYAFATKTIDPEYLAKSMELPRTYPIDDAPYNPNFLGGFMFAFAGISAGIIVFGLGEILGKLK